jgi:hypothetical protein
MASLPPTILPRVGALLRLLGSDQDGEALGAARALGRTLSAAGLDLHALADVVEHSPISMVFYPHAPARRSQAAPAAKPGRVELSPIRRRQVIDGLTRAALRGALSAWESEFCASVVAVLQGPRPRLSARQHEIIEHLMTKFGENRSWA